jgi:hypothetical protein
VGDIDGSGRLSRPHVMRVRVAVRRRRELRETEVEDLHDAIARDPDVGRLQIAMDDPLLVRGIERVGKLASDPQRFVQRDSDRAPFESASVSPSTSSITRARTVWLKPDTTPDPDCPDS